MTCGRNQFVTPCIPFHLLHLIRINKCSELIWYNFPFYTQIIWICYKLCKKHTIQCMHMFILIGSLFCMSSMTLPSLLTVTKNNWANYIVTCVLRRRFPLVRFVRLFYTIAYTSFVYFSFSNVNSGYEHGPHTFNHNLIRKLCNYIVAVFAL